MATFKFTKDKIVELLKDYNAQDVIRYANYLIKLANTKDKKGDLKNLWLEHWTSEKLADTFKSVAADGLVFDGIHITLQKRGPNYDYIAYKNKMLIAYPESKIDFNVVFDGDEFTTSKESGAVNYVHNIKNPFDRDEKKIIGGYCVIKNKRGENMTLMSQKEFEKHRAKAETDSVWREWYIDMCYKTLIRKACKVHYSDIYEGIIEKDNENYDLDNPVDLDIEVKGLVDECKTVKELEELYHKHKGKASNLPGFNSYIAKKKRELKNESL